MQSAGVAVTRSSPYVRVVLREIERSGSGSRAFWAVFWAAFPHLSDAELERVALATGVRGRAYFRAITEASPRR